MLTPVLVLLFFRVFMGGHFDVGAPKPEKTELEELTVKKKSSFFSRGIFCDSAYYSHDCIEL